MPRRTPPAPEPRPHTRDAVVSGAALSLDSDDDRSDVRPSSWSNQTYAYIQDDSRLGSLPDDDDDWLTATKKTGRTARSKKMAVVASAGVSKSRRRAIKPTVAESSHPPALKAEDWGTADDDDSLSGLLPIVDEGSQPPLLFAAEERSSPAIHLRSRKVKKTAKTDSIGVKPPDMYELDEGSSRGGSVGFGDLLADDDAF